MACNPSESYYLLHIILSEFQQSCFCFRLTCHLPQSFQKIYDLHHALLGLLLQFSHLSPFWLGFDLLRYLLYLYTTQNKTRQLSSIALAQASSNFRAEIWQLPGFGLGPLPSTYCQTLSHYIAVYWASHTKFRISLHLGKGGQVVEPLTHLTS